MEESTSTPLAQNPKPKRSRKKLLVIIVLIILSASLVALGLIYNKQRINLVERNREIDSLRERIAALEPGGDVAELPAEEDEPPSPSCVGGSTYTAEIGRFRATLDSPRVIIRKLDAGFEGGPITSLQIGSCLPGVSNVVDLYPTNEVNVIGHPSSSSSDLKAQYESSNGVTLTPAGTLTVAGETAQKYTADGLFSATLVYFDHAGIGYQIELVDTGTNTNATLTDLTSDWAFTP